MNVNFHLPPKPGIGIRAIFQTHGFPEFERETILPKGVTEIIFDLSETSAITAAIGKGSRARLPKCFIVSYSKEPIYVHLPKQQTYFGVVLDPVVVNSLLGVPAGEFANRWVDLTLVDCKFNELWEQLAEQKDFNSRVALITNWVKQEVELLQPRETMLNEFLCGSLNNPTTVPEVAENLCYSPRQLARKIQAITGMNTEEVLLFKKYLRALNLIHHSNLQLVAVAHESYFTDQSHFIKAFRSFSNMTPGEYSASKRFGQAGHLFHNVR